jgi:hypothetical protein
MEKVIMISKKILKFLSATIAVALLTGFMPIAAQEAQEAQEEEESLPVRFGGTIISSGTISRGITRVTITIEKWSSDDDRQALYLALRDDGTDGLVREMNKMDVGYIQIDNSLGYRLRSASTWQTEEGQVIRVATDRPIAFGEVWRGTRSEDYPIGVAEFILPPEGPGEGTILAATQVSISEDGHLEVKSLPNNTGAHRMTNMEPKKIKKKKNKKSD